MGTRILFSTSEHNLSKSSHLFELIRVIVATVQDVQKKIDTKFKMLKLLEKETLRIYEYNKESELIKQKQLYEKRLDEIKSLKMEILEAMIENENTEEEIEQWSENHKAAVASYDAQIEDIEKRIKKNSEEIRRRKKNPGNADGSEEERREGERRKEERIQFIK